VFVHIVHAVDDFGRHSLYHDTPESGRPGKQKKNTMPLWGLHSRKTGKRGEKINFPCLVDSSIIVIHKLSDITVAMTNAFAAVEGSIDQTKSAKWPSIKCFRDHNNEGN
jgi:hypothetical protein